MNAKAFQAVIDDALQKTQLASTPEVEAILKRRLKPVSTSESDTTPDPAADTFDFAELWDLEALEVSKVGLLQTADTDTQQQVKRDLAQARFFEAYAIEKAGMSFAAKMSLLATTLNEQKLYSLFAAEEARHFHFIDRSLGHPEEIPGNPFIDLLNNLIIEGERSCLLLLVQVVLEGWGIEHYAKMANTCQHPATRAALNGILADEAAHHGSGVALFEAQSLNDAELDYLETQLRQFLQLVAVGPVGCLQVLETHLGPFSAVQKQQVLEDINARKETQHKLNLLKKLLEKAQAHRLVERLSQQGAFSPLF